MVLTDLVSSIMHCLRQEEFASAVEGVINEFRVPDRFLQDANQPRLRCIDLDEVGSEMCCGPTSQRRLVGGLVLYSQSTLVREYIHE
jgi:hypothetical protein